MKEQDSTSNALADALTAHARTAATAALRHCPWLDAVVMLSVLEAAAHSHACRHYREIDREWRRGPRECSADDHMVRALVDFLHTNLDLNAKRSDARIAEHPFEVIEPFWTSARVAAALTHDPVLRDRLAKTLTKIVHDTAQRTARAHGLAHLAEDLTQDAFVYLYAEGGPRSAAPGVVAYKLRGWKPREGKPFRNYIRLITMRFIRKDIRRRLQLPEHPDDVDARSAAPLFRAEPSLDRAVDLETVMAYFTAEDHRLIRLVLEGYSSREIQRKLGLVSENIVNVRKSRLRKKLRRLFPGLCLGSDR